MGINVASSFSRQAPVPIDDLLFVADLTARDAIDAGVRYEGMFTYVVSEGLNYQLVGGITNSDWLEFGASGGGGAGSPVEFYTLDGFSAPSQGTLGLARTYEFSESGGEHIFLDFVVPPTFQDGDIMKLKGGLCAADSSDTTKDLLLVAKVLSMQHLDPIPTAVTGGYDSTNTEVGVIANANFLIPLSDIDLCGVSSGFIPGETKLIVAVYRDISNETASFQGALKLIQNSFYLSLKD